MLGIKMGDSDVADHNDHVFEDIICSLGVV